MRRIRMLVLFVVPIVAMLAFADPALAVTHGGEGLFGHTDDAQITNTMFLLLGLFPILIVVFSLIQAWLDRRKHHKIDVEKAKAAAHPFKGGW